MEGIVEIKERKICKIGNKLVEAKYKLTIEEQRLILLTIAQIDVNDENFKTYYIKLKDLEEKTGHLKKYSRLKVFMENIMRKPIWIDKNQVINWFSSLKYVEGEGKLEVRFDKDLKPFLLQLKEEFTKYSLNFLLNLQSVYAVRLYQLLKQYQTIGKRKFNVDKLREILQTPKSYNNFQLFTQRVLRIAEKEINSKTDIKISWEITKRIRRKVVEIEFTIVRDKNTPINDEIKLKEAQIDKVNNDIAQRQQTVLKNDLSKIDDFKLFRTKILKEYRKNIFILDNQVFSIKGVYLALNDKVLKADEALNKWHWLFENKDKIQILDKEEYEEQQINQTQEVQNKLQTIKEKIFYQIVDYGEFKDEFEFRILQIDKVVVDNVEMDFLDFQIAVTQNKIGLNKQIMIIVIFEMVEDRGFNFSIKGDIETFYKYDKFMFDPEQGKFEWIK